MSAAAATNSFLIFFQFNSWRERIRFRATNSSPFFRDSFDTRAPRRKEIPYAPGPFRAIELQARAAAGALKRHCPIGVFRSRLKSVAQKTAPGHSNPFSPRSPPPRRDLPIAPFVAAARLRSVLVAKGSKLRRCELLSTREKAPSCCFFRIRFRFAFTSTSTSTFSPPLSLSLLSLPKTQQPWCSSRAS